MNAVSAYENLYNQMKNTFTVVNDNCEYTLGEYMLMKAGSKKTSSNLPVKKTSSNTAISTFFRYVNDKLTVKAPPAKDKTIRKFPLRTSCAALLSALVASTLLFSYGSFSMKSVSNAPAATVETVTDNEETKTQNDYQCEK